MVVVVFRDAIGAAVGWGDAGVSPGAADQIMGGLMGCGMGGGVEGAEALE